jgi:hypothetical protein
MPHGEDQQHAQQHQIVRIQKPPTEQYGFDQFAKSRVFARVIGIGQVAAASRFERVVFMREPRRLRCRSCGQCESKGVA